MAISSFRPARVLALAVAVFATVSAASAATVAFRIDRTSADIEARTFSGGGRITFDGPASVTALSLGIETVGGVFVLGDHLEMPFFFDYGASDVLLATGLSFSGGVLNGSIALGSRDSTDGGVVMGDLTLDFTAGAASGFCFSASDAECIFGGGTSSAVDAAIVAPVPLPASLPLLGLVASLGLAGMARARRAART